LRSQISPHFIFNVLNGIVYLIRSKSEQAERVTIQLSELMSYMLYESDGEQVTLEKELKYLENYIQLQRLRFEDDVQIDFEVNGQISTQMIEPMLLIPFVENAFKHGVGMIESPLIDIKVICDEKSLVYRVKNKIAPETPEHKDRSSGIGLKNVRRRLELLYPDTHEFSVQQMEGWFEIALKLKLK
jgi:LytS/YehU family sensor histidine kinase